MEDYGDWNLDTTANNPSRIAADYKTYEVRDLTTNDTTIGSFTNTGVIKVTGDTEGLLDRFYVMALSNVSDSMNWTTATQTYGTPNNHINDWWVPSSSEWRVFAGFLGIGSNYSSYGLSSFYWSSTEHRSNTSNAWEVDFFYGKVEEHLKTSDGPVRLCTTF